jgi:hypothetical protein
VAYETYLLGLNEDLSETLVVDAVYALENGTTVTRSYTVLPDRRFTIWAGDVPELNGQRFSVTLEGRRLDGTPLAFVAERAVYWGALWYGGHASLGVPRR